MAMGGWLGVFVLFLILMSLKWYNTGKFAMLRWLQGGEGSKKNFENLTQMRVGYEIWQRLSGQRDADALRNQTILNISKYVKDHPKATKEQLTKEIGRQIQEFAERVEKL